MLREHGAQRPTVFELLTHVHRLRGTRSKFSYNVPSPQPLLSPSQSHIKQPPPSSPNPLEGLVTYAHSAVNSPPSNTINTNQGIQARDRVLEAIAPMRRGRPNASRERQRTLSRPVSPRKGDQSRYHNQGDEKDHTQHDFTVEQERAWKAATERSAIQGKSSGAEDVAWAIGKSNQDGRKLTLDRPTGFGDDFAEKLWSAPDPNLNAQSQPRLTPSPNRVTMSVQRTAETPAFSNTSRVRPKQDRLMLSRNKDRDAFEGLGLMTNAPKSAPTLGEARKLRTGLAMVSMPANSSTQNEFNVDNRMKANSHRPTPSPQSGSRYLSSAPLIPQSVSPVSTTGSPGNSSTLSPHSVSRTGLASASSTEGGTAELRFPSVEELDAQFGPPLNPLYPSAVNEASARYTSHQPKLPSARTQPVSRSSNVGTSDTGNYLKPSKTPSIYQSAEGTRSEQVTGIAMRDIKDNKRFPNSDAAGGWDSPTLDNRDGAENSSGRDKMTLQPRPLVVRKRGSTNMKPDNVPSNNTDSGSLENNQTPALPARPQPTTSSRDWLTGDDDHEEIKAHVIIRNSPSKRASFVENSDSRIISGSVAQHVDAPEPDSGHLASPEVSPTMSKFKRAFPPVEAFGAERPSELAPPSRASSGKKGVDPDSSSADEGPEDPSNIVASQKRSDKPRGRQSSVHNLVYQYGGGLLSKDSEKEKEKGKEKEKERPRDRPTQYSIGTSDYVPSKSRQPAQGLSAPTPQPVNAKTPSPTITSFKPSFVSQSKSSYAPSERPQLPPVATKPLFASMTSNADARSSAPSRARPQSMFMFPSKSTDTSSAPSTNNLVPPPEQRPRAMRRTSISDMVQLYENISGTGPAQGSISSAALAPVHKPLATKGTITSVDSLQSKSMLTSTRPISSIKSTSIDTTRKDSFTSRTQSPVKEVLRKAEEPLRFPVKISRALPSSDIMTPAYQQTALSGADDNATPRANRVSTKEGQPTSGPTFRTALPNTRPKMPSVSHNNILPKGSPRKPPVSLTEEAPAVTNPEESSSPERPYQGVGRLIDQWQKKSTEADQSRPGPGGKRVDLLSKRAGIIHIDDR